MKKFNDFLEEKKVEEETGTAAVAGAGDDSSTVVVKKKKKIPMNTLGTLELKSESVELEEARVETSNKHDEFKKSILRDYPKAEFRQKGTTTHAYVDAKKHGMGSSEVRVGEYDHKDRRGFKYDKPNVKESIEESISALKKHSNWSQNDYNYLSGKGYSHKEIKTLWDRDAKSGKGPTQGNKSTMKYPDIEKGLKHQAIHNKMNEASPLQMAKNAIGKVVNKKNYQAALDHMKKTGKSAADAAKMFNGVDARTLATMSESTINEAVTMASPCVEKMRGVLGSAYSLQLKSQHYHWNVQGPDFIQYHEYLGDIYEFVYSHVDRIAEEIRTLDAAAIGSFSSFASRSRIQLDESVPPALTMLANLAEDFGTFIGELKEAAELAEELELTGLVNYLEDTTDKFNKRHWMLKAIQGRSIMESVQESKTPRTFKMLTEAAYKPDPKKIEAAMRKALKDKGNYNKDGSVNWNYVDADVYMAHGPESHKDAKAHYRVYDSVASKLTKELGLKESVELEEGMDSKSTASLQSAYNKYKDQQLNPSDAMKVRAIRRELMKRGVSLQEESIEEAYTKQQLIKMRQILGREGQLNKKVGVEKLMKHVGVDKQTAHAMHKAATVSEDIDEGWENPLRAAREKKEREDAAKKSGSDKQEYSKRLNKKQYGSMMGGLKEDSIEEGIKPYVSGTDKWEVLNSKGKTVKSFPKTTAGMKDAQAYLDKNFAKLKEDADQLDEAKSYVVMNKKTGKAVTKPMSMSMALDSYDSRGGNAKGLAVVAADDKRLKEGAEEQLDEISKKTLASYVNKATTDAMSHAYDAGGKYAKGSRADDAEGRKHVNKAFKRKAGIDKAVDRLTKEEVEQVEESLNFMMAKTPAGKEYQARKAQQRRDMNKQNDPGAAKKHLGPAVLDQDKAHAKAKKKGANPSEFEYAVGAKPNKMTLIQKGMDPSKARERTRRKLPEEVSWAIATIEEAVVNQAKIAPETIKKIKDAFAKTAGMDDKALKIVAKKTGVDYETVKMVLDN